MMFATGPPWPESMFAVNVGMPAAVALEAENDARKAGLSVIHLDLTGVVDEDSFVERLSTTFMFPYRIVGLNAALDWMSGLEWFGNPNGYLVRVDGLDDLADSVVDDFAWMLPQVIDRARSGGAPYVVVLVGERHRAAAMVRLTSMNERLAEAGKSPWVHDTRAVTVSDYQAGLAT